MDVQTVLLVVVVATALAFDFTNGFHDTGNAMATSIATGALGPRVAVTLCAVLNFVGALLSLSVAATIAKGIVDATAITLTVVFAGLVGGIMWNLLTWYRGIPSSSSHALIGGVIGATVLAAGFDAVQGVGVVSKVLIPALLAPFAAGLVAVIGTFLAYRITKRVKDDVRDRGFRVGQVASASLVSLAHGTNDAQKTMGVITLALVANKTQSADASVPTWVVLSCAVAIGLGTFLGGWRVIRTLGKGLIDIEPPQGFAAEGAAAAVILASSHLGYPLSTTHVCSGAVVGSGLGKRSADVRWNTAARMAVAWVLTIPAAGIMGAAAWALADVIGGAVGVGFVFVLMILAAAALYAASRRSTVNHLNVNDDWDGTPAARPPVPATSAA